MQKPADMKVAAPKHGGNHGRFVGLVATGRERYQVVMLETIGDVIVTRKVLDAGRTDVVGGKHVTGNGLAGALASINVTVGRYLRDVADLWQGVHK